jgi:RNA polymerase sigma-70 factor (ECF subfamily)
VVERARESDEVLLRGAGEDPERFGVFYRRHERVVLGFFVRATGRGELAVDLAAETFARAFESRGSFDPLRGDARPWLFGIARHVLAASLDRGRVEAAARQRLGMSAVTLDVWLRPSRQSTPAIGINPTGRTITVGTFAFRVS